MIGDTWSRRGSELDDGSVLFQGTRRTPSTRGRELIDQTLPESWALAKVVRGERVVSFAMARHEDTARNVALFRAGLLRPDRVEEVEVEVEDDDEELEQ